MQPQTAPTCSLKAASAKAPTTSWRVFQPRSPPWRALSSEHCAATCGGLAETRPLPGVSAWSCLGADLLKLLACLDARMGLQDLQERWQPQQAGERHSDSLGHGWRTLPCFSHRMCLTLTCVAGLSLEASASPLLASTGASCQPEACKPTASHFWQASPGLGVCLSLALAWHQLESV